MTNREHDKPIPADDDAERFWSRVVDKLGRPSARDVETNELAAAERRMAAAEDAPLPAAAIDAIVGSVTAGAGVATPRPRRRIRRLRRAAVLPFAALLAAMTVLVLIWPEGRESSWTMSYEQAVRILQSPEQPLQARSAALRRTVKWVEFGFDALRELRASSQVPAELRVYAANALTDLGTLFADPSRRVLDLPPSDQEFEAAAEASRTLAAAPEARLRAAASLKLATAAGVAAIRDAPARMPDLQTDLEFVQEWLLAQLGR